MSTIRIRNANGTWTVRAGGAVLAESKAALALSEGDLDDVIYFPPDDVALDFLDDSDHSTHCPHKGDASYFSIATKSKTIKNAAWSYQNPTEEAERIKGYLAFYTNDDVAVERI